ncbi:ARM repeat-containing protein [Rhizopogon vinicolor AM-OR11-026]|uniref:Exportin-T n=1 Tax=Rhizopogon vinicolor AM-OR11-026 TaxID=1314800 RepID=A0A1B7NE35_9AGAM|nr:ARM repeat-containing protein [Rhizopogon vinicolor AM-OR11-026]
MEEEIRRYAEAIRIASEPSQGHLHQQALEYLSNLHQNANETWRLALTAFTDMTSEGRKYPESVRFDSLRLLEEFLDNRFEPLDEDSFHTLQQSLISYVRSEYVYGSAESHASYLRNKFSYTLTLFFLCTYVEQWPTFFNDLFSLIRLPESQSQPQFNRHVSLLLFHIITEISGEVADQTIKSARTFNPVRHTRDSRVRDAVRDRDAPLINEAVLTIIVDGMERMAALRKTTTSSPELFEAMEIVDWGVRTFGSYAGWIDINLTVTPVTIPILFTLLQDPNLAIRLATSAALQRIVGKGLKEPEDKLQLIKVLALGQVIDALESKTRAEQVARGSAEDEGEESYREALGRLLNVLGLELSKLAEAESEKPEVAAEASRLLEQILPVMLRFMSDKYDDTCSTVFPLLQTVLASYKRTRKMSTDPLEESKRSFLVSLLQVIMQKMKWDDEEDPCDLDEDDNTAFETLRKDLRLSMDAVFTIDQELVTNAVRTLSLQTLSAYRSGMSLNWNDAELAVYLVYLFGEIMKTGGKGRAAFCVAPLVPKEKRREVNYSEYPLTPHGEMLLALVQSGVSAFPHRSVTMQFFETVARYGDFFKIRKECIMPTLEAMVDTRGLHNPDSTIRSRTYYLFHRFIKEGRNDISEELAVNLVEGIRDLLNIQVDIPTLDSPDDDLLEEAIKNPGLFDSQLYLFEIVGTLISLVSKSPEQQANILLSIVTPLLDELSSNLPAAQGGKDVMSILRIHHSIMALGNIAKGFPDYPSPVPEGYAFPSLDVFRQVARAILGCLEAMNVFKDVRNATRHAFARIIATTGSSVTQLIPSLMANLLAQFEPSELVDFMNFIGLLIHKLQRELFNVLDELIGPLSAHITQLLSQPIPGTDDSAAQTKRAYLTLLTNIMSSDLHDIFISDRNKAIFEPLLNSMSRLAEDISDSSGQKSAFAFLSRCVQVWCQPAADGQAAQGLPGFERFVYERLVPTAFVVLSSPQFNIKDGQMMVVLLEIGNFLQIVCKTRGQEAQEFFLSAFLPSQGWPPDTAMEFTGKLRDLDNKAFRKYFADFVRSSRSQASS